MSRERIVGGPCGPWRSEKGINPRPAHRRARRTPTAGRPNKKQPDSAKYARVGTRPRKPVEIPGHRADRSPRRLEGAADRRDDRRGAPSSTRRTGEYVEPARNPEIGPGEVQALRRRGSRSAERQPRTTSARIAAPGPPKQVILQGDPRGRAGEHDVRGVPRSRSASSVHRASCSSPNSRYTLVQLREARRGAAPALRGRSTVSATTTASASRPVIKGCLERGQGPPPIRPQPS